MRSRSSSPTGLTISQTTATASITGAVMRINHKHHHSKKQDLSKACVDDMKLWRHREEEGLDRDDAVGELSKMLKAHLKEADKSKLQLAPVIGHWFARAYSRRWRDRARCAKPPRQLAEQQVQPAKGNSGGHSRRSAEDDPDLLRRNTSPLHEGRQKRRSHSEGRVKQGK